MQPGGGLAVRDRQGRSQTAAGCRPWERIATRLGAFRPLEKPGTLACRAASLLSRAPFRVRRLSLRFRIVPAHSVSIPYPIPTRRPPRAAPPWQGGPRATLNRTRVRYGHGSCTVLVLRDLPLRHRRRGPRGGRKRPRAGHHRDDPLAATSGNPSIRSPTRPDRRLDGHAPRRPRTRRRGARTPTDV